MPGASAIQLQQLLIPLADDDDRGSRWQGAAHHLPELSEEVLVSQVPAILADLPVFGCCGAQRKDHARIFLARHDRIVALQVLSELPIVLKPPEGGGWE